MRKVLDENGEERSSQDLEHANAGVLHAIEEENHAWAHHCWRQRRWHFLIQRDSKEASLEKHRERQEKANPQLSKHHSSGARVSHSTGAEACNHLALAVD